MVDGRFFKVVTLSAKVTMMEGISWVREEDFWERKVLG